MVCCSASSRSPAASSFAWKGAEIVDGRLTDEIEDLEALVGMRCVASLWVVTLARPGKEQRAYYLTGIRAALAD